MKATNIEGMCVSLMLDEEKLKEMLAQSDKDFTLQFARFINQRAKENKENSRISGDPDDPANLEEFARLSNLLAKEKIKIIPDHWIIALTELIINAGEARQTNKSDPIAEALCMKNVNNESRNIAIAKVIGFYVAETSGQINKACKKTNEKLKEHNRAYYGITTLKDIWYEFEKQCPSDKDYFELLGDIKEDYPDYIILTSIPALNKKNN